MLEIQENPAIVSTGTEAAAANLRAEAVELAKGGGGHGGGHGDHGGGHERGHGGEQGGKSNKCSNDALEIPPCKF